MRLLVLSALLLPVAGCDSVGQDEIAGSWTLARVVTAQGADLGFRDGSLRFGAGTTYTSESCNDCSGTYDLDGGTVTIVASCTERACLTPPDAGEGYVDGLDLAGEYAVSFRGDSLALQPTVLPNGRTFVFAR